MAKCRAVVAVLAALAFAIAGVTGLRSAIDSARYIGVGSAGLGAVSIGISESFVEILPILLANRLLSGWARRMGGRMRMLHRLQTWTIAVWFVLFFAFLYAVANATQLAFELLRPLGGFVWSIQFLFAAALLGTYAIRTART